MILSPKWLSLWGHCITGRISDFHWACLDLDVGSKVKMKEKAKDRGDGWRRSMWKEWRRNELSEAPSSDLKVQSSNGSGGDEEKVLSDKAKSQWRNEIWRRGRGGQVRTWESDEGSADSVTLPFHAFQKCDQTPSKNKERMYVYKSYILMKCNDKQPEFHFLGTSFPVCA